eukprot:jgi/Mesen1/1161/ME000124S00196
MADVARNFEAAVTSLLHSNDVAAGSWLVAFQSSAEAWEAVLHVLAAAHPQGGQPGSEVALFAAQILKHKIQREGGALGEEGRGKVKEALVHHCLRLSSSSASHAVVVQLCGALACLLMRAPNECNATLEPLLAAACAQPDARLALTLLAILPEEYLEAPSSVPPPLRHLFSVQLLEQAPRVLHFLTHQAALTQQQQQQVVQLLQCLLSWTALGCFGEAGGSGSSSSVSEHPLVGFLLRCLLQDERHDVVRAAADVLIEMAVRHQGALQWMLPALTPALSSASSCSSAAHASTLGPLTDLLVEIGLTAVPEVAQGGPLPDALLLCMGRPGDREEQCTIAQSTVPLWCAVAEHTAAQQQQQQQQAAEAAGGGFRAVAPTVLSLLLMRAQLASGAGEVEEEEEEEDSLQQYRGQLEELLPDVCRVMGPALFLSQELLEATQLVQVLAAVAELSSVMPHLPPPAHLPVLRGAGQLVATFADAVRSDPSLVVPLLGIVGQGVAQQGGEQATGGGRGGGGGGSSSEVCCAAIRRICEAAPHAAAAASPAGALSALLALAHGLGALQLGVREDEDIMCAVVAVLSRESVGRAEVQLGGASPGSASALSSATRAITRMGALCTPMRLDELHAQEAARLLGSMVEAAWVRLRAALACPHAALVEAAARCLLILLQAPGEQQQQLLGPGLQALAHSFATSERAHAVLLRTAAALIDKCGAANEREARECVAAVCASAHCRALASTQACDAAPDVAESLMQLLATFVRCCSFADEGATGSMQAPLQWAAAACAASHRSVALSAASFVSALLELALAGVEGAKQPLAAAATAAMGSARMQAAALSAGPLLVAGLVRSLLAPGALARVRKVAIIFQQLAVLCAASPAAGGLPLLHAWLSSPLADVQAAFGGARKEDLVHTWSSAVAASAHDRPQPGVGSARASTEGYLQGPGGRLLKRCVRDFAELHKQRT